MLKWHSRSWILVYCEIPVVGNIYKLLHSMTHTLMTSYLCDYNIRQYQFSRQLRYWVITVMGLWLSKLANNSVIYTCSYPDCLVHAASSQCQVIRHAHIAAIRPLTLFRTCVKIIIPVTDIDNSRKYDIYDLGSILCACSHFIGTITPSWLVPNFVWCSAVWAC